MSKSRNVSLAFASRIRTIFCIFCNEKTLRSQGQGVVRTPSRYEVIPCASTFELALISAACKVAFAIGGSAILTQVERSPSSKNGELCKIVRNKFKTCHWCCLRKLVGGCASTLESGPGEDLQVN